MNREDSDDDYHCIDCDYTIDKYRFEKGDGRIMFSDVGEEGEYRCGVCDDRCSDPYGMFPDTDADEQSDMCEANPPYYCDGGCGKKVGEGHDHDCKRVCDECESESL